MQNQWPLLGKELFALEHTLSDTPGAHQQPLTEQEKAEKREEIRNSIVAQLYRDEGSYTRDTRHLAFLLLKAGRGGAIVGNPYIINKDGKQQELPYTGLEGYYAGSEETVERPGMTPQAILQEEADIGSQLLKSIKKHAIKQNSWVSFSHLKQVLAGREPDLEELRAIESYWGIIVRQLHVRIYHNAEFELTLSEQIEQLEQLLNSAPGRSVLEKQLEKTAYTELDSLKQQQNNLSEAEKDKERQERSTRERIRSDRLAEFHRFREETYHLLAGSEQGRYAIGVHDATLEKAAITETITLPKIPERSAYAPTPVHFTQQQLEGYLFLARLGGIGGDPLARSVLVSQESFTL